MDYLGSLGQRLRRVFGDDFEELSKGNPFAKMIESSNASLGEVAKDTVNNPLREAIQNLLKIRNGGQSE